MIKCASNMQFYPLYTLKVLLKKNTRKVIWCQYFHVKSRTFVDADRTKCREAVIKYLWERVTTLETSLEMAGVLLPPPSYEEAAYQREQMERAERRQRAVEAHMNILRQREQPTTSREQPTTSHGQPWSKKKYEWAGDGCGSHFSPHPPEEIFHPPREGSSRKDTCSLLFEFK